jgi:hypothetical protein
LLRLRCRSRSAKVSDRARRGLKVSMNYRQVKETYGLVLDGVRDPRQAWVKLDNLNTSFSEMMGLPGHLLDTTYWFPWYNNSDLDTQLRFGVP